MVVNMGVRGLGFGLGGGVALATRERIDVVRLRFRESFFGQVRGLFEVERSCGRH